MEFKTPVSLRWRQRWMPRSGVTAIVVHGLLLASILHHGRGRLVRSPGTTHGKKTAVTYSPGRSMPSAVAALQVPTQPPKPKPKPETKPKEEKVAKTGGEALGEGDVTVALATFFPTPKPDLTTLPHGTRGDVVIDIVIDETGKIVDTKVDQGLGDQVDEAVMATVETWTFQPATKDGKPVASEQQLLFHYERA
jgi:periplasmic protein TonB